MARKPIVYISGPLTQGSEGDNIREAIKAGDAVAQMGYIPIIPHLNYFWHIVSPHRYSFWMNIDLELVSRCDAVLRLEGYSPGAERETKEALRLTIPVFFTLNDLKTYLDQRDMPA